MVNIISLFFISCASKFENKDFKEFNYPELKESESSEFKVVLECDTLNFAFNLSEKIILLEGYCPYKEYSSNEKLKGKKDCNFYYDINLKKVLYHHNEPSFAFDEMLRDSTFSYFVFNSYLLKYNDELSKREVYNFDFDELKMIRLNFFKNDYVLDEKLFSSIKVSENGIKDRNFVKTVWSYLQKNKIVEIALVSDKLCAVRTESDEVFIVEYDEKAIGWDKNEILSDYNEKYSKRYNKKPSKIKLKKVGYKLDQIDEKRFIVHDYYKFSYKSMSFLFKITTDTDNVENFRLFLEDHPTYRLEDFDHIELINEQPTPKGEFFIYDKLTNRLFSFKFKN